MSTPRLLTSGRVFPISETKSPRPSLFIGWRENNIWEEIIFKSEHWNSDQEKDQRSPVDGSDSEIVGCVGEETIESARRIVRIDPLTGELKIR